jgi:uncharacterized membrane protein
LGHLGVPHAIAFLIGVVAGMRAMTAPAAIAELISDQLPSTPSRTVPVQFGTRIAMGALCGAALTAAGGSLLSGSVVGVAGAVVGTLGGRAFRARLAAAFGSDRPAAFMEDALAITGGLLAYWGAR